MVTNKLAVCDLIVVWEMYWVSRESSVQMGRCMRPMVASRSMFLKVSISQRDSHWERLDALQRSLQNQNYSRRFLLYVYARASVSVYMEVEADMGITSIVIPLNF